MIMTCEGKDHTFLRCCFEALLGSDFGLNGHDHFIFFSLFFISQQIARFLAKVLVMILFFTSSRHICYLFQTGKHEIMTVE